MSPATADGAAETLEELQARHRREKKGLQGRVTNKKKNASKKTRKGVNDECAALERDLAEKQAAELAAARGDGPPVDAEAEAEDAVLGDTGAAGETAHAPAAAAAGTSGVEPSASDGGQQQQQQRPGAKRNRQKERLARRAAEQDALAAEAAAEAAGMTDHRATERAALADALASRGLTEHDVAPDGHCLFSAVADQLTTRLVAPAALGGARASYAVLRRVAADHIATHAEAYAPFIVAEDGAAPGAPDVQAYVRRIRDTAEWGGQLELQALAEACAVEIVVLRRGGEHVVRPKTVDEKTRRLWLAYYLHEFGLGEHYNSLRGGKA
ncbi:uncharacterized protein BROUX77_007438 [Berkeleyomyces rouxiae]|uniref:uncharacterized protein n=1 Tax=Berkeleyomyces rouxiae TaxID=2035830 RepID=UPI003B76D8CB